MNNVDMLQNAVYDREKTIQKKDKEINKLYDKINKLEIQLFGSAPSRCLGYKDEYNGDYDCGYDTVLTCEECKFGMGRKDPEAKCNQLN